VEAETLFDGISYGKGSSFLKQVYKYLSPKVFKEGIRIYF
jgi:aminopeptidase N